MAYYKFTDIYKQYIDFRYQDPYKGIYDFVYTDNPFLEQKEDMRKAQDNYPTPDLLSMTISEYVLRNYFGKNKTIRIMEPACGEGSFIKALRFHAGPAAYIAGLDIRNVPILKEANEVTVNTDWLTQKFCSADLIITNPPYSIANNFVRHTLEIAPLDTVCVFLLRLSFLGGKERYEQIYKKYPLYECIPLVPRPSFTEDSKTDASEYAVFIWVSGNEQDGRISTPLVWK